MTTKPILKWVGSKRKIAAKLLSLAPTKFFRYHEPFCGGLSMFLAMHGDGRIRYQASLTDASECLMSLYTAVRDNPDALIAKLSLMAQRTSEEAYYEVREMDPDVLGFISRGARAIYLNKTCFNGVWRVNSKGKFNTPWGNRTNPKIVDEGAIMALSKALQNVSIGPACDFASVIKFVDRDDFVYMDPPYLGKFSLYHEMGFEHEDHEEIRNVLDRLTGDGVKVMISNSEEAAEIFDGYRIERIDSVSTVSQDPESRGATSEIVVMNY
jgi:DNA adenine methylase